MGSQSPQVLQQLRVQQVHLFGQWELAPGQWLSFVERIHRLGFSNRRSFLRDLRGGTGVAIQTFSLVEPDTMPSGEF